jgi:hypothetical protein
MDKQEAMDLLNTIIDNHKTLLQEDYDTVKSDKDVSIENKVHEFKDIGFKLMVLDELKEYVRRYLKG